MAASSRSAVPISSIRPDSTMMRSGIFRVGAKRRHVGGDPPHRPHEQIMQRQIDQRRCDAGDQERDQKQVDRIAQHGVAQRRLVDNDFDIVAAHGGRTDDPHHAFLAVEHHLEGVDDRIEGVDMAHVEIVGDRRRRFADGEQPPLRAHLHGDGARPDAVEDLLGQAVGHHAVWRGIEHQRRRIGAGEPVVQPHQAIERDRGHIDQHFRDHHEQDREDEELSG